MQCSGTQLLMLVLYILGVAGIVGFVLFLLDTARSIKRAERLSAEVREMHDQAEARALRFMVFQYALWLSARNATIDTIDRPTDGMRLKPHGPLIYTIQKGG